MDKLSIEEVRAKRAEYAREWRKKNKEKHKQYVKNYREKNRDKVLEYARNYARTSLAKQKRREYISKNREAHNTRCRNYYAKNKTRYQQYRKAYYEKNAEMLKAKQNYKNMKRKLKKSKDIIKQMEQENNSVVVKFS
tara:strand:+ start:1047 stop:1457 length:411 start_codon:yes stop_codon:yes gene_type:complete